MRAHAVPVLAIVSVSLLGMPLLLTSHAPNSAPLLHPREQTTAQAPKAPPKPLPWPRKPLTTQEAEGGIWRTDNGFQPMLMLKNGLEIAPIAVTPVLHMADGTEYDLPPIQLDPSGVAMVNILDALQNAPANVQSHISTFGSAGMKMQWAWPGAVHGAVRNTDEVRGLIYQTHIQADVGTTHNPAAPQAQQMLDAIWWKQEPKIQGFMTLMNSSLNPITATVQVFSSQAASSTSETITVDSHNTQWIDLNAMWSQLAGSPTEGGVRITYNGIKDGLLSEGGLEDGSNGYSHMLHFWPSSMPLPNSNPSTAQTSPAPASQPQSISYDSAGLMIGTQDPEMLFPAGTMFTPYVVVRNNAASPRRLQLAANLAVNGKPSDISLGAITLVPQQTEQLDIPALLKSAGLGAYNGFFNFRASFAGDPGDLILETGSVDQTFNFVFEVPPAREQTGGPAQNYSYWNSGGDTDTMVTLWNYSDQDQDLVVTFFHQQGKYEMPIHLGAHATYSMSMAALIRGGAPDRNGNVIPSNIFQGSAKVSGVDPRDPSQKISVAVSIATFNSRTGTCNYPCEYCDGPEDYYTTPGSATVAVNASTSFIAYAEFDYGSRNVSDDSDWSSEDDSVADAATDNDGTVEGKAPGSTQIDAAYDGLDSSQWTCQGISGCTEDTEFDAYSDIAVTPTIAISGPAYVPLAASGSSGINSMVLNTSVNPSGGTYNWSTTSSNVTLGGGTGSQVTVTAAAASVSQNDTPITVTYTVSGQSGTNTLNITVVKPTSLSIVTDSTNGSGHTCTSSTVTPTCSESSYTGSGSYTSYVHNRLYKVMDQFTNWISGYAMTLQESYSTPTGTCSGDSGVILGNGTGDEITDCWYFCSQTCKNGGTCGVSASQTVTVNGFTVATKSVNWTCTGATVTP